MSLSIRLIAKRFDSKGEYKNSKGKKDDYFK